MSLRNDDNASVSTTGTMQSKKKDMVQRVIDKLSTYMQKEENKQWLQVFVIDPVLSHIIDRVFPYVVIVCIIMVVLIILIILTFFIVFTKLGQGGQNVTTNFSGTL
jgi:hypothetical protein